jgi:hypothetical protein
VHGDVTALLDAGVLRRSPGQIKCAAIGSTHQKMPVRTSLTGIGPKATFCWALSERSEADLSANAEQIQIGTVRKVKAAHQFDI